MDSAPKPIADSTNLWNVTFISDSSYPQTIPPETIMSSTPKGSPLPLSMTAIGDRVWVVEIKGGHMMVRRLTDLGIVQGSEISVVSRTDNGSIIVGFQGCRIGLGAGMAHRVIVTTVEQDSHQTTKPQQSKSSTPSTEKGETIMPATLHLGALSVGQSGRILGYEKGNRAYREKLLAMGLTPGTHFTVTRQAPMGDPIEVEVRGFKLSLRKGEAATLQVETLAETSGNRAETTTETITPGERSHD